MKIADAMLIGGGMAYTFLKAQGLSIGKSLVEEDKLDLARKILGDVKQRNFKLILPLDNVVTPEFKAGGPTKLVDFPAIPRIRMGLDIGPEKTIAAYSAEIAKSKTIVWNARWACLKCRVCPRDPWPSHKPWPLRRPREPLRLLAAAIRVAAIHQSGLASQISHIPRRRRFAGISGRAKTSGVEALSNK